MKLTDKRRRLFRRIKRRSLFERILLTISITILVLLVVLGYVQQAQAESQTPTKEAITVTSSSTSAEASAEAPKIVENAPVVVPEVTKKPEIIKDTSCQEKVAKLAKGSILYKYYDNVSKEVGGNCQKIRNVFALAFAESGLCKNQRGYNCFGIMSKGKIKMFGSFENAMSLLNENIGKYIGLSDSGLINNKSYCGSGCTHWSGNIRSALNKMK